MDSLTLATLALTGVTLLLSGATIWLVFETKRASNRQIQVQMWLEMMKRFDSREMKHARKTLATRIKNQATHQEISETVMDFFEDVGTLLRHGHIDKTLVESSLGFYATRWWEAIQPYVLEERRNHNDDKTVFEDLETFGKQIRLPHEKVDTSELKRFLDDEARLVVD
jgi:hypothetical protein